MSSARIVALAVLGLAGAVPAQATWRGVPELSLRAGHAMAYDPVRGRVVLFGGGIRWTVNATSAGTEPLGDTWEWNGTHWEPRTPAVSPPARKKFAMAFDPIRQRVLLFGGMDASGTLLSDTWEWDGRNWTRLLPKHSPPACTLPGMATDATRRRIVLFGGNTVTSSLFPKISSETWEWNGNDWVRRLPKTVPTARSECGMAFDTKTGRVAMFGGLCGFLCWPPNYTWEWNGTDWLRVATTGPNIMGTECEMAADPASGTILLHLTTDSASSTRFDAYWRWDGATWRELKPVAKPPLRGASRIVDDPAHKRVVLFGGFPPDRNNPTTRDTWTWDGATWTKVADRPMPMTPLFSVCHDAARDEFVIMAGMNYPARWETWVYDGASFRLRKPKNSPSTYTRNAFMVYHAAAKKVLLYERVEYPAEAYETWLWDGQDWTQDKRPGPKDYWPSLAYDSGRGKVVFVGMSHETWEWDENGWVQRTPKTSPLGYGAIAYDVVRRRVVLYTDASLSHSIPNRLWEWDGTDWHQQQPKTWPPARFWHRMAYVPALGGVVAFGGIDASNVNIGLGDSWLWNGKDWTKLAVPPIPAGPTWYPMSANYDPGRQRLLAFYFIGVYPPSSVWELVVESLKATQPYPHLAEAISLDVDLAGQAGAPFVLALSQASRPGIPLRSVPGVGVELLPLAPDNLFWLSLGQFVGVLDSKGKAKIPLAIPNDPGLLWFRFHAAGFTLQPGPTVGAISNRVELQVVR